MGRHHKWTDEEDAFLLEAVKRHSMWSDLYADMSIHFVVDYSVNALKVHCINQKGLKLGLPHKYSPYSQMEKEFVLESVGKKTLQEIADGLEKLSGRKRTKSSVGHYITDALGLNPSGVHGNLSAWETAPNTRETGVERTNSHGYTYIKGEGKSEWIAKHQMVWEKHHEKIPDGCVVIFLNRNKDDFSIENLYCVDRKIHAVMCRNGWYSEHPELTLAAIKWCELFYTLKEVGKRD